MAKKQTKQAPIKKRKVTTNEVVNNGPPNVGEETLRQGHPFLSGGLTGVFAGFPGSDQVYAGGTTSNPAGFPFWGSGYWGTYQTYRFMLDHYKIRNIRARVLNAMLDATWEVRVTDDSVPKKLVDTVKALLPLRRQFLEDAFRALDYGCSMFEKIWKIVNDRYYVDRFKPLMIDTSKIITDMHGNLLGISQSGIRSTGQPPVHIAVTDDGQSQPIPGLDVYKSFVYPYDKEGSNWLGRSRLENIRNTAWMGWLDCAQQLQRLGAKVSGFQPVIKVPAGDFKRGGVTVSYKDDAEKAMQKLVTGGGIVLENLSLRRVGDGQTQRFSDPDLIAKLAQASLVDVDVLDFGNQTPAIEGLLKRMVHFEGGMVEGYLHAKEETSDSEHSSRANAKTHTEQGELDPMALCSSIDWYFNTQVVDQILELNANESARGLIQLYTPAIKTAKVQMARELLNTMVQSNHILGEKITDTLGNDGMKQLFLDANLKTSKSWEDAKSDTLEMGKQDNAKGNFTPKETQSDKPRDGSQSGGNK